MSVDWSHPVPTATALAILDTGVPRSDLYIHANGAWKWKKEEPLRPAPAKERDGFTLVEKQGSSEEDEDFILLEDNVPRVTGSWVNV